MARRWRDRAWFRAAIAGVVLTLGLPVVAGARAQAPSGAPLTCKQMWLEATEEAARAALEKARLEAGARAGGIGDAWATAWVAKWKSVWEAKADTLVPGPDGVCCDIDWFELAAQTGKAAWTQALGAAPIPSGAVGSWAGKFSAAYAKAWADAWFVHYPVVCAEARVNASASALAKAKAGAQAGVFAWANGIALAGAFSFGAQDSFQDAWGEGAASAWAEAGAAAEATAEAAGTGEAATLVEGNCASVRANSCARAAASAFASAWAESGANAFADAYADAYAEAYAAAFANSWAKGQSAAGAVALSQAAATALARAVANGYAAAWQELLANHGELPAIVHWWITPGAPKPAVKKIQRLLARDQRSAMQSVAAVALKKAVAGQTAWGLSISQTAAQAKKDVVAYAAGWVSTWATAWAADWAEDWIDTYIEMCSEAAASVCAECPPCEDEWAGEQPGQEDYGWPEQPQDEEEPPETITNPKSFTYTLVGLGVTAGNIFGMVVTNENDKPVIVEIPGGTVFEPDDPEDQREEISQPVRIHVPANGKAQAPLDGYCLDYEKQPPPAEQLGVLTEGDPVLVASLDSAAVYAAAPAGAAGAGAPPAKVTYHADPNANAGAQVFQIILAGDKLAAAGKFHDDLPPARYKLAVIQRAIWVYESKGTSKPQTRDTLLGDIRKQVKETGGTQTDEQIQQLADHIMEDVNATLAAAGV
ncbi:MAG: hypothetical protein WA405_02580 [Candidatus Acidiferrales bacterium]